MARFADRLAQAVLDKANPVLVGLDPRLQQLPEPLLTGPIEHDPAAAAEAFRQFCFGIIDVVAPLVPAVKPQAAFFEELGPTGMAALADVIQYARNAGLLVILDAKRGDIGSTAQAYARAYLGRGEASTWGADALTVNPYLGDDSLTPFVEACDQHDAGIFVLVKTSNPGGKTFQDLQIDGKPLYRHAAKLVDQLGKPLVGEHGLSSVGAVVGATYPEQLAELREAMPNTWLLVPGFGAQGGTAAGVAAAFDDRGLGAIINNSRAIIFAHKRPEFAEKFGDAKWQEAVEAATREMIQQLSAVASA